MATKKILGYPESSMTNALSAVRCGMPVKTASKTFKVPKTTLLYKFKGINPEPRKIGPATIFSETEEDLLVTWITCMAKSGFSISKDIFLSSASKLAKELKKNFKNNMPGRKWYEGFLRRHPELSLRTPQNLTMSRASVKKIQIRRWFIEVYEFLEAADLTTVLQDPTRIFNADESAFFLNPKGNKVLTLRSDKTVYATVNSNENECLTVLLNGNAAGTLAPPMIIFRYKRIPSDLSASVPRHWGIGVSENGWMTSDTFYSYMANVFYPWAKENVSFPIFFVDGHSSHLSYHLSRFCSENQIILVALYPNATHLLQPMDVAVFRTLKSGWKEQVSAWRLQNQHELLRRRDFAPLLDAGIKDRVTPEILQNGFKKCGLFPWDPEVVSNFFPENDDRPNSPKQSEDIVQTANIDRLAFMESFIDQETLESFQEHLPEEQWSGRTEDKSLFEIWKKMKQSCGFITKTIENMIEEAEIVFEDDINFELINENNIRDPVCNNETIDSTILTAENPNITNISHPSSSKITSPPFCPDVDNDNVQLHDSFKNTPQVPELNVNQSPLDSKNKINILDVQIITPIKPNLTLLEHKSPIKCSEKLVNTKIGPIVPSPFKRALFWPESKPATNKKTKEKIPSVVTSQMWQEYSKKKSEKKAKMEADKLERKRKLEAKKKDNNKVKKKVVVNTQKEMDESESTHEDNVPLSRIRGNLTVGKPKPLDYVVVKYDGKYFPGKVTETRNQEYFVSAMVQCGRTGWRWPDIEDQIWYDEQDVVMIIEPPKPKNSRGIFFVEEMKNFTEFTEN